MAQDGSTSYGSRLVELAIQVLITAVAVYWAVQLLETVWLVVVMVVIGVGALGAVISWLRRNQRGW